MNHHCFISTLEICDVNSVRHELLSSAYQYSCKRSAPSNRTYYHIMGVAFLAPASQELRAKPLWGIASLSPPTAVPLPPPGP